VTRRKYDLSYPQWRSPDNKKEREGETQASVCFLSYQNMGGIDEEDELLQMYQVQRKGMNEWCMKLFRSLLSATVLKFIFI
jgi:hypothetical protein